MHRSVLALAALALCVAPAPSAANNWPPAEGADLTAPQNWPNDPDYGPTDTGRGQWNYWSFVPAAAPNVRAAERSLGSGIHADEAWQKTIGDRRILIAVIDSGIRWSSPDLVNKFYLNAGELPPPDPACGALSSRSDPHDANGDGIFNVQDYTRARGHELPTADTVCDPRVHDTNGNGIIDPQDLIAAFSDGHDDDGNGYVDDISGWDMLEDDNDPNDDTNFGHGSGEARDSSAEGNNGRESLGVCPECTVMMVRAGDSFVVEANEFAMGVLYAVDRGASVIQEALGGMDNTSLAQQAIDYAYEQGVLVVASAADEDSFHQNFPASNQHTMMVHAIRYDSESWQTATTFLNFNNCTNYGAQLVLSTPGTGCSSEATGRTSGIVGLLYSMALAKNLPAPRSFATDPQGVRRLSAEEVKQLLIATVDDIDIEGFDPHTQYPSQPGWEQRFGYGRPNVGRAVRQIETGRIPPEVDIDRPYWFEVINPDRQPQVPIVAHIDYRRDRYQSYDLTLEYALGVEPRDDDASAWHTIVSRTAATDPLGTTVPLTMWDVSQLEVDNPPMPEPDKDVNRFLVTLRLRVIAHSQTLGDSTGVMRKAVHIYRDPTLLPGFPIRLGPSGESSPKLVDLDGDGGREIVIGDADGRVHAFRADGQELPGWPFRVGRQRQIVAHATQRAFGAGGIDRDVATAIIATPAVGDLDGDGKPEVVVATRGGEIWALGADGSARSGFPVQIDRDLRPTQDPNNIVDVGFFASPVLADLDGDHRPEIIIGAFDGKVYAFHGDGSPAAGFPVLLHDPEAASAEADDVFTQRVMATPAVGDIDHDGHPDIVLASTEHYSGAGRVYAVHHDGMDHPGGPFLSGWPVKNIITANVLPVVGNGIPNSVALADVDGDGTPDAVLVSIAGVPYVYKGDATRAGTMQNREFGSAADAVDSPLIVLIANPTLADLDGDGRPELVVPAAGFQAANAFATGGTRSDFQHELAAWNPRTGDLLAAFPRRIDDWQFFANPIVADVNSDGRPEIIAGSAGYYLHAWDARGQEPSGWPKFTGGWILESAAVGDLDGDGKLEVVVGTRNGWLYAWHTDGRSDGRIEWASFHHDLANTGNLLTPLDEGRPAPSSDGGCAVAAGEASRRAAGSALTAAVLLGSLLVLRAFRRAKPGGRR
jgi:hypothetical protein